METLGDARAARLVKSEHFRARGSAGATLREEKFNAEGIAG